MAQADTIPTSFSIRHKFEELPIFHEFIGGTVWRTGRIDGEFEVTVDPTGWSITDIWLDTDNGRFGSEARAHTINLDAQKHEGFYLLALDAIEAQYKSLIEELIADECDQRDLRVAA